MSDGSQEMTEARPAQGEGTPEAPAAAQPLPESPKEDSGDKADAGAPGSSAEKGDAASDREAPAAPREEKKKATSRKSLPAAESPSPRGMLAEASAQGQAEDAAAKEGGRSSVQDAGDAAEGEAGKAEPPTRSKRARRTKERAQSKRDVQSQDEAKASRGDAGETPEKETAEREVSREAPAARPAQGDARPDYASMSIEEMLGRIGRRRRGRPSKKAVAARQALEKAQKNPTPELVAQARELAIAVMTSSERVKAEKSEEDGAQVRAVAPAPAEPSEREGEADQRDGSRRDGAASEPAPDAEARLDGGYGQRRRRHERRDAPSQERDSQQRGGKGEQAHDGKRQRDDYKQRQREGQQAPQGGANQQRQRGQNGYGQAQQQFGNANGNRRNNNRRQQREALVPKVNKAELEELKVGELRAKATELGIDPSGFKKSELVDAVYSGLVKQEGFFEFTGILDITPEGFGFVRTKGYLPSENDVYVGANVIRSNGLRRGDEVSGVAHTGRPSDKYPAISKVLSVCGQDPEAARSRPRFGDLTPVFPTEPLRMEHGKDSILGRCIDLVAPIGKGQRGLIVSPPKAGKTTVLKKVAESVSANNPEVHLICLLIDERPEEVTDMQRSIKGEVVASTFDMPCDNHITVAELVVERAKRLVELGQDVLILLDSITRLARAYNQAQPASGRILSGGVDSTALYPPKRFLGAARNIEGGGSLTILASALIDTGSKMDEVIFEEFKGTGNMELRLDRDLADRRIFPAIDPVASGTRKEELLIDPSLTPFIWGIRRILANMNNNERAMTSLIKSLKATTNNEEFLIRSAKKAQMQESSIDF